MIKKNFTIIFVILAGIAFGVFLFTPAQKTFYIKNDSPYLANLHRSSDYRPIADNVGNLSNTIIPSIKVPENLTENFAGLLAKEIIDKNDQPKDGNSPAEPGLNMPNPNKIVEEFIKNGLKQANENILNIAPVQIKISTDNSKDAVAAYLSQAQTIINKNLAGDGSLSILDVLKEINDNKGAGLEKLLPIISAYEATANQLQEIPVPADLKNLMTEEIRLLRITANILKALTNIEKDPLGALAATKQFEAVIKSWVELQIKSNIFVKKLNKT